jgi:hypothetical protein
MNRRRFLQGLAAAAGLAISSSFGRLGAAVATIKPPKREPWAMGMKLEPGNYTKAGDIITDYNEALARFREFKDTDGELLKVSIGHGHKPEVLAARPEDFEALDRAGFDVSKLRAQDLELERAAMGWTDVEDQARSITGDQVTPTGELIQGLKREFRESYERMPAAHRRSLLARPRHARRSSRPTRSSAQGSSTTPTSTGTSRSRCNGTS